MGKDSFKDTLQSLKNGNNPLQSQTSKSDGLQTSLREGTGLINSNFGLKTIEKSGEDE